jgi:hypothetical protein
MLSIRMRRLKLIKEGDAEKEVGNDPGQQSKRVCPSSVSETIIRGRGDSSIWNI